MNPKSVLEQRGILAVAQENGWEEFEYTYKTELGYETQLGWIYPIASLDGELLIKRWKNVDSDGDRKYAWPEPEGKPDEVKYYDLPTTDLRAEIAKNGGVLIIASGEPDVLAFAAAGILNVICWFGEASVPKSLPEDLESLGATKTIQFVDSDKTGVKAAKKVASMLCGTGISYIAYELPKSLGEKGDINKLWMVSEFNTETFKQTLDTIQMSTDDIVATSEDDLFSTTYPAPAARAAELLPRDVATLPREFLEAIENRLPDITRYNANGFSNAIPCIFTDHEHDHIRPAAAWNRETNLFYCLKCGQWWYAKETGERLGISLRDYFADNRNPTSEARSVAALEQSAGDENVHVMLAETDEASEPDLVLPEESIQASKITDIMIGKHIIALWQGDFRFFHGLWHSYANGVWTKHERIQQIENTIWNVLERYSQLGVKPNESRVSSVASYLRAKLYVADELIDNNHDYLNVRNGLLNLDTFELEEHQRDLYLTSQRSIAYDANATCPTFDAKFDEWMRDASGNVDRQKQAILQEALGYSLTPDTRYEKAFWLYGPAASGKSTILKILMKLSGDAGVTLALDYLDKDRYQLANLAGKHVAISSEAANQVTLQSDLIKQLISGDPMPARQIYGVPFMLRPQAKLWWGANELPYNPDRSDGIYRRLIILEFHNSIPAEDRDIHLMEKLTEELPGILNRALAGLKRLKEQGHFTESSDVDAAVEAYKAGNDHELAFTEECCNSDDRCHDTGYILLDDKLEVKSSALYKAYKAWCLDNGIRYKSTTQVAEDWRRLGFTLDKRRDANYWVGVELKP